MKKIVLFSRCELTHLYGRLDKHLASSYEIIHLAYSEEEEQILRKEYGIDTIINFKEEIRNIYNSEIFDINICNKIDSLIIEQTAGRFCLNSAIQSDRTFEFIPYHESLLLSQVYYKFWEDLVITYNIKYLIHEPTALYFTHIASIVCKKNNAQYLSQIQAIGEYKQNWLFILGDNGFPVELNENLKANNYLSTSDRNRAKKYIENFREDKRTFFSEYSKKTKSSDGNRLSKYLFSVIKLTAKHFLKLFKPNQPEKLHAIDHVELFSIKYYPSYLTRYRALWDVNFSLKYDSFDDTNDYYYYPIHLEPEAVVLYWGDGIYKNQVKLIENIAGQLPPNCWLYVKDHPHGGSYREYIDYKRIKAIPNVKLINPKTSGRMIISKSRGVITINGTSGFEALMLNKQVYAFGHSFYTLSNRVVKIRNIRDLQKQLYSNYTKVYNDDDELFSFINSYLNSLHEGFTDYFLNYAELCKIDSKSNSILVAEGVKKYFDR